MMKIGILTSSRADYGIYLPLLKKLAIEENIDFELIVFGTHLSVEYGHTLDQILKDGFEVIHRVITTPKKDSEGAIAKAIGDTIIKFGAFWEENKDRFDLILSLGDRYEMFAAVAASVPFNLRIAHLHGGETTLGAIDNKFRHSISLMSELHFTSTQKSASRVRDIMGSEKGIYFVGALSLDNISEQPIYSLTELREQFGIDMSSPTILVTFHPETVNPAENEKKVRCLEEALSELLVNYSIVITMPNADTGNSMVRKHLVNFVASNPDKVFGVESLGTRGYFSCIHHASFLLGNTSSGIIEAASFKKYVINIGDRQAGREAGENIFHIPIDKQEILACVSKMEALTPFHGMNIYGEGSTAKRIIEILKSELGGP